MTAIYHEDLVVHLIMDGGMLFFTQDLDDEKRGTAESVVWG